MSILRPRRGRRGICGDEAGWTHRKATIDRMGWDFCESCSGVLWIPRKVEGADHEMCLDLPSGTSVLSNGGKLDQFEPTRGLRQGGLHFALLIYTMPRVFVDHD